MTDSDDKLIEETLQGMRILRFQCETMKEALDKIRRRAKSTQASTAIQKQMVIDDMGKIAEKALYSIVQDVK